ncbi:rhodanese-like domain-containing protein [soil metagenome]
MEDITAQELKERLDSETAPVMLDVREDDEVEICTLLGAIHIPMGEISSRLTELEEYADEELVVYCHHGVRSASVKGFLEHHGFTGVRNLMGGIDLYSASTDEQIPRY